MSQEFADPIVKFPGRKSKRKSLVCTGKFPRIKYCEYFNARQRRYLYSFGNLKKGKF